jgi:hypothetical protein
VNSSFNSYENLFEDDDGNMYAINGNEANFYCNDTLDGSNYEIKLISNGTEWNSSQPNCRVNENGIIFINSFEPIV